MASLMSKTPFDLLCESISTTLVSRAGSTSDARTTAEAAAATWRRVNLQLAPVIGERGIAVLFSRALHQTSAVYPWLVDGVDREGSADPLPHLTACLARQQAAAAAQASATLLLSFAESLSTLIGASLTARLLAPVWAAPTLPSYRETHDE